MANDLTVLADKILARAMMSLRSRASLPRLVNSDFSAEAAKKGQTIEIPIPTAVGIRDVVASVTDPTPVDQAVKSVKIDLNYWKQTDPLYVTDAEVVAIDVQNLWLPPAMQESVNAMASFVNQTILSKYIATDKSRAVYGSVGTAGTTPFGSGVGVKSATDARKVLNVQKVPATGRIGVLDFTAEAEALALAQFSDVEKVGERNAKIDGEIGRKFGIDWYADDDVPYHVAGTIANASAARQCAVNNGAGYAAGISTINVDMGASASVIGTIKVGDVLSFVGHTQTYTVIANAASAQYNTGTGAYTFATNAIAGLSIYPALTAAVADNEVITVVASHRVNLVFHRDAFAFANRPLMQSKLMQGLDNGVLRELTDPQTGLTMRLEIKRQHKQVAMEFDMLFGTELVRPQLALRILG